MQARVRGDLFEHRPHQRRRHVPAFGVGVHEQIVLSLVDALGQERVQIDQRVRDARVRPVEDRGVAPVDDDIEAVEVAVGERHRQLRVGPVLRPVLRPEREQLAGATAPCPLNACMLPQRGCERGRHRLDGLLAVQLAHQHPAALSVDPKHLGDDARMLSHEGPCDHGLVVEERERRLQEDRLAVKHAAEHRGQRPHPVGLEGAPRPRLRCGEPAGSRPNTCRRSTRSSSRIRSAWRRYGGLPISGSKAARTSGSRGAASTDGRDPPARASSPPAGAIA
jgi:hypothetical protein